MAKVTYLDPNDDAPKIAWMGQAFKAHLAVEVANEELVKAARSHPYFEVEEAVVPTFPDEDEPPFEPTSKKAKR